MKYFKQLTVIFSSLMLFGVMAACTPTVDTGASGSETEEPPLEPSQPEEPNTPAGEPVGSSDLVGTNWILVTINGNDVSDSGITLEFSADTLGGSDGCNSYGTGFKIEDGKLTLIGDFISTLIACPDIDFEMQNRYFEILRNNDSLLLADEVLKIQSSQGELIFEQQSPQTLENTNWILTSLLSDFGLVDMPIDARIEFTISGNEISGYGGCNNFSGSVALHGGQLTILDLISTEMYCEADGVSDREFEFISMLNNVSGYEVMSQILVFYNENEDVLATFRTANS